MAKRRSILSGTEFIGVDPITLRALAELARQKLEAQLQRAQLEQEAIGRHMLEANAVDGMGAVEMRLHGTAYHEWAHREGTYDCWKDRQFRKDFMKRAPEARVKCTGTKIQVGWTPDLPQKVEIFGSGNAPRFRKQYEGGDR